MGRRRKACKKSNRKSKRNTIKTGTIVQESTIQNKSSSIKTGTIVQESAIQNKSSSIKTEIITMDKETVEICQEDDRD